MVQAVSIARIPSRGVRAYPGRNHARQRGVVLVLVLWAGALLGVIAASFAFGVRTDNATILGAGARLQANALAESAVNRALLGLLAPAQAGSWASDGRAYEMPFEGGTLRASTQGETGKIDLNAAPAELLHGLIEAAQTGLAGPPVEPAALTAAVLDWRDGDRNVRPLGAEDSAYRAEGLDYEAGDRAFVSPDELSQVLGMSDALLERLLPAVTVYTRSPRIDPRTAPRLALLAVPGLNGEQVDAFISERDRLLNQAPAAGGGTIQLPVKLLAGGASHLSFTQAQVYTILAEGRTSEGISAFRQAVVQLNPGSQRAYRFLAWADDPVPVESSHAGSTP